MQIGTKVREVGSRIAHAPEAELTEQEKVARIKLDVRDMKAIVDGSRFPLLTHPYLLRKVKRIRRAEAQTYDKLQEENRKLADVARAYRVSKKAGKYIRTGLQEDIKTAIAKIDKLIEFIRNPENDIESLAALKLIISDIEDLVELAAYDHIVSRDVRLKRELERAAAGIISILEDLGGESAVHIANMRGGTLMIGTTDNSSTPALSAGNGSVPELSAAGNGSTPGSTDEQEHSETSDLKTLDAVLVSLRRVKSALDDAQRLNKAEIELEIGLMSE